MTALTVYLTKTASTTLTTAEQLYSTSGSPSVANAPTTKVGTARNWGEVYSQGTTSSWSASGSAPSPSGNGFLWDVTTLETMQINSGSWSGTLTLIMTPSGTSMTADVHVRAYKRSSGGTYTAIVDTVKTGQFINAFATTVTLPSTSGSAISFVTGDKLYLDVLLNITTASLGSTATVTFQNLSLDTSGKTGSTGAQIVSPGYQVPATAAPLCITDGYGGVFS